jgi:hypothetical protein
MRGIGKHIRLLTAHDVLWKRDHPNSAGIGYDDDDWGINDPLANYPTEDDERTRLASVMEDIQRNLKALETSRDSRIDRHRNLSTLGEVQLSPPDDEDWDRYNQIEYAPQEQIDLEEERQRYDPSLLPDVDWHEKYIPPPPPPPPPPRQIAWRVVPERAHRPLINAMGNFSPPSSFSPD